jgi:hypothetical protein
METRSGHIDKGVVVLDEPTEAPDGTKVTVLISVDVEVEASPEELEVIEAGLREASGAERINAREFLRELRTVSR